jgi:hypothetical protein
MPDIDVEVLQKGFGFLWAMVRPPLPGEALTLQHYARELFDLEMRTLPRPQPGEENYEIEGTAYPFDAWVMARVAEFIASANFVEVARQFYRPIVELGPPGRYWVEDFLQSWISYGLQLCTDLVAFARIWEDNGAIYDDAPCVGAVPKRSLVSCRIAGSGSRGHA